jgi:hypothetical protein
MFLVTSFFYPVLLILQAELVRLHRHVRPSVSRSNFLSMKLDMNVMLPGVTSPFDFLISCHE